MSAIPPCEVSADCLECPLSRCRYDAPTWFQKGVQSRRAYAIAAVAERVGRDAAAAHCGVSKRTVFRVLARMTKDTNSPEDRAVFAGLAWRVLEQRMCKLHQARLSQVPAGRHRCIAWDRPPYWGLRDYGLGQWQGGDAE